MDRETPSERHDATTGDPEMHTDRSRAIARLRDKRDFGAHVAAYAAVHGFLVGSGR